jgi:hypothetical protein
MTTEDLRTELVAFKQQYEKATWTPRAEATRVAAIEDELAYRATGLNAWDTFEAKALERAARGWSKSALQQLIRDEAPLGYGYTWPDLRTGARRKGLLLAP